MNKICLSSFLLTSALLGHEHNPSVSMIVDSYKLSFPLIGIELSHQSNLLLDDSNIIILHGFSDIYTSKTFQHGVGVGFRRLFENFGLGSNFLYSNQNSWGFFNHQLSPGFEIFTDHFAFNYNYYRPIRTRVISRDNLYSFYDVSEFSLSYRPSKKYEFGIAPYINHQTKRVGYSGVCSAYFLDNWKASLIPYYDAKSHKGICFSLGYHFGGAQRSSSQDIKKSHRFFFDYNPLKVKPKAPVPVAAFIPIGVEVLSGPIIQKSDLLAQEEIPQEVKEEIKQEVEEKEDRVPDVPPAEPKKSKDWLDYLFFWRSS